MTEKQALWCGPASESVGRAAHQRSHARPARPTSSGAAQVLRCVDWGDAREARAAAELVARWAPVGLADALELLSPAFTNPEVPRRAAR